VIPFFISKNPIDFEKNQHLPNVLQLAPQVLGGLLRGWGETGLEAENRQSYERA